MYIDSPSKLAHDALGEGPVNGTVDSNYKCNFCGHDFTAGGHKYKPSSKFNNHADTYHTDTICPHCKQVTTGSKYILQNKCAVYTTQGVFTLNKDVDLAAFIYHPPAAPFLAVYATIKQQHVVWRTPVAQSNNLFPFRWGDDLFMVDRNEVVKMADEYVKTLELVNKFCMQRNPKARPLPSFFAVPTSAIRKCSDIRALMTSSAIQAFLHPEPNDDEAQAIANKTGDFLSRFNALNYAEIFFVIACQKTTAKDTQELAQNRLVKP